MPKPLRLSTASPSFEADFKARLHWSSDTDAAIEQRVADILADVKLRGDAAVLEYTERFDSLKASGESWTYKDAEGTLLGQKVTPLDRVGIYVPGGKAAYPSSVLMNAIPAHVAGVQDIIMVVPTPRSEKNALVLAAAYGQASAVRSPLAVHKP